MFSYLNLKLNIALAQSTLPSDIVDPLGGRIDKLSTLFNYGYNWMLVLGISSLIIILALIFLNYITSSGDAEKLKKTHQWLTYAIVGGIGILFVLAFKLVVLNGLNANIAGVGSDIILGN